MTLGLCVKNDETTITKTLDSILSLDYPHDYVEIVVVDGCSKDRTGDIIKKRLKTSEFKWKMLSDDGRGLGYARQLVIIKSGGKYVIWIDGDHIVPKDYVKKHVEFMERYPSLAGANALMSVSKRNVPEKLEGYFWYFSCKNAAKRGFELKSLGSAGGIFRIQAIKDVGGYDTNIKGACEDGDLARRLVDFGWKLSMNLNTFYVHLMVTSWISIWKRHFWYGYGNHYLKHKYPDSVKIAPYLPPRSTISGFKIGIMWYKLTRDFICLLEPIHKTWRCIAWLFGYLKAHLRGYGHKK